MLEELDRRLAYGPGMRVQRLCEAASLLGAFATGDARLAVPAVALTALQALSPRLAPVAVLVSLLVRPKPTHALADLYFDPEGTRWACIASLLVQLLALWLLRAGYPALAWPLLALPAASFLLAPTVGFCCGCAVYVTGRELLSRLGLVERFAHGACDVDLEHGGREASAPAGHQP